MSRFHLLALIALLLSAIPAHAQSYKPAMETFCREAAKINRYGFSVEPGTEMANAIIRRSGQSSDTYNLLFSLARTTGSPTCRRLW